MKKYNYKNYFPFLIILFFSVQSIAQKNEQTKKAITEKNHCGTMFFLEDVMQNDNDIRLRYNQSLKDAELRNSKSLINIPSETSRTTAIITIPVVFHIVLNNPFIVTDADIQAQIDRMNLDFSGKNSDSTNASLFYSTRGHSEIRFCLAKRDPSGKLTNGIERKSSTTKYTVQTNDPIKIASQGGLDAWNAVNYLNIWIGQGEGLGYSTFPGTTSASQDGIVINLEGASSNPCYTNSSYNLGRTVTHEVGHYLGLYHIWGDSPVGCTTDDFRQLPGSCSVPASLLIGDTPNQNNSTTGCPSGLRTDACSVVSPGFQYQNYMDYTNDACMTMFTNAQVSRMEWVLINCRPGLLSSAACNLPVSSLNLDAAIASIINPGGNDIVGCAVIAQAATTCSGSITPKLIIQNKGLSTLTSIKVGLQINSNSSVVQTFTVNLPTGGFIAVSLSPQFLSPGNNSLRFFTSEPNAGVDENTINDQVITNVFVGSPINIPLKEDFEIESFPPSNWTVYNPDNNNTWSRFSFPGNGSTGSAFFDNYSNNNPNQIDELRSVGLNFPGTENVKISFDLAYKNSPALSEQDTLSILVSNNCGNSFTSIYKKWGANLSTAGSTSSAFLNPMNSDWKNESIIVPNALFNGGQIVVAFRNTNRYGNNIFIDNINITPVYQRDIELFSINDPKSILCSTSTTPSITVKNAGVSNITSFNVHYRIDNNPIVTTIINSVNIPQNGTLNLNLSNSSNLSIGSHSIRVYINSLVTTSGTGDLNLLNDSLLKNFSISGTAQTPITESFESINFPPVGWSVTNPDKNISWSKYAAGYNSSNSAYINTFNYQNFGQVDQLFTPVVNYSGADSLLLNFQLSAATYSDPRTTDIPLDTLEVLVTKDCGNTYTSVYKKWGVALQTINDPVNGQINEFFPTNSSQWRLEKIDLTSFAANSPIQIAFRVINNFENNIFIDNVNLKTVVLPAKLKKNGYLVLPSPFKDMFSVWFRNIPTTLSFINVFNSNGQLIWSKQFNNNAAVLFNIDLSGKQNGIYFVHFGYSDQKKTVVERIIKQ